MKILLTSENYEKVQDISNWLKKNNIDEVSFLEFNNKDILIPVQPINTGCELSCNENVNNMEEKDKRYYDLIISFDECIKIESNEIKFYYHLIVKNIFNKKKIECKSTEITINYKVLNKYPSFIKILKELYTNYIDTKCKYIYDGCEVTLSNLISKHNEDLTLENWTDKIYSVTKSEMFNNVLDKIDLEHLLC